MPNITIPNTPINSAGEKIHAIWKLTRGMLAAGWKYKASADALQKEVTGDPSKDLWSVSGYVNLTTVPSQTGSALNVTTVTNSFATITGLTGMAATSVGHALVISGATSAGNNGTFRIASFISSASVTIYNPSAVASDTNNGAITWSEQYGGGGASVTSVTNGIATITGLAGMTTSSVGHLITFTNAASGGNNGTFMVVEFVSSSSVKISNTAAVAGDANNTSITWTERDPAQDTYPASITGATGTGAWINLQGPSTMKIPIGSNIPSATFIRGEKVTQAATGCEGEILGVVTDATNATGFLVIAPRVNGSGGGPRGWDTSTIAAQAAPAGSGASVTPSATAIEYVREIVIWKGNSNSTGHIYYQCIDQAAEGTTTTTTGRFSTMASTLSQVTATVCPGGSTGGSALTNGFPTVGTLCCVGTGGSGAAATGQLDLFSELVSVTGMIQVCVANNIESTGVSPDGSWTLAVGTSATSPSTFTANCFMRLDDTEDGDVDPYVLFFPTSTGPYLRSRTVNTSALASGTTDYFNTNTFVQASGVSYFLGWRRRGFSTGDAFQEFSAFALNVGGGSQNAIGGGGQTNSFAYPDALAHTFASPAPRIREPIWIISVNVSTGQTNTTGIKMRKGTMRWWYMVSGGVGTETMDGKRWVQGGSQTVSASNSPIVFGPWDGVSIPVNG